ncbi:lysine-specific demethylase SE14-like [Zingiber officinale]|uniref:lysine-specific demethylase SE14-like n=1 Tax=Zingiber officinale TaxID=94328 RepID=UPI001C4C7B63|nr:lysine-specific demethylase SE14-like [Zingiber officinale]
MAEPAEIPAWLKNLPMAPEYHPTETEFADPIAFISRIERTASAFGICKVIPPLPRPSKKFVLANLNRTLSTHPDRPRPPSSSPSPSPSPFSQSAVFTTRCQELGAKRGRPLPVQKQVWQSGEFYTLDHFEAKSKAFARTQLTGFKEVDPLLIETLFWKAAAEKPVSVEYANDVPGSGFGVPEEPVYLHCGRKQKKGFDKRSIQEPKRMCPQASGEQEGMNDSGWKLSNSPWNLQVIARSPGSLTRFMPDEVPGVTSPMVYIGMLFSWFAWHVEDHELHSLNFLHMGSPKTWYAIPGDHAAMLEEIIRIQGYGGSMDRLASLIMLGEKTTLLSPEILVLSGIPCCRLVQRPGEFVVTFPRAYHIGFSHGFNCGEAANFATPKWLTVAKEAAVRRAAMNFLPMLSHQQLLYLLSISFVSSVPRELLPGGRSSRLRDRRREEKEVLVKKAFLEDMMSESNLLFALLSKAAISSVILWEPESLPSACPSAPLQSSPLSPKACKPTTDDGCGIQRDSESRGTLSFDHEGDTCCTQYTHESTSNFARTSSPCIMSAEASENAFQADWINSQVKAMDNKDFDEIDLPCGLNVDSGSLACVACGILGYPFMAILQPSEMACMKLFPSNLDEFNTVLDKSLNVNVHSSAPCSVQNLDSVENQVCELRQQDKGYTSVQEQTTYSQEIDYKTYEADHFPAISSNKTDKLGMPMRSPSGVVSKWNLSSSFLRPRIFCLQHALEAENLLQCKGGAHLLVICHSDYLKMKALALSIAEDINIRLNCDDVPLVNGTPSDLDLINMSIDEEGHDEDGNDWTSKLGLNLKYCVKLKKQMPSNKDQLTLSLGGIFSDPSPMSVVSNLKWLSKKFRTPYKVVGIVQSKSHVANVLKYELSDRNNSKDVPVKITTVHHGSTVGSIGITTKHKFTCNTTPTDSTISESRMADSSGGDDRRNSGAASEVSGQMIGGTSENLHNIPILIAEYPQRHLVDQVILEVRKYSEVAPPSFCRLCTDNRNVECCEGSPEIYSKSYNGMGALCDPIVCSCNNYLDSLETGQAAKEAESKDKLGSSVIPKAPTCVLNSDGETYDLREISVTGKANQEVFVERESSSGQTARCLGSYTNLGNSEHNYRSLLSDQLFLPEIQLNKGVQETSNNKLIKYADNSNGFLHDNKTDNNKLQEKTLSMTQHVDVSDVANCTDQFVLTNMVGSSDILNEGSTKQADMDAISVVENSVIQEVNEDARECCTSEGVSLPQRDMQLDYRYPARVDLIQYVRRGKKRNYVQATHEDRQACFIRGPCEGLRPRSQLKVETKADTLTPGKSSTIKLSRRPGNFLVKKDERRALKCDIEGCYMSFGTRRELSLHKRNRCTIEGCKKRFSSHRYAAHHQCVHKDDRPLVCPWKGKGCNMTFKWAWARTEHIRLHTGERPYKCKFTDCGQTFRFVSDFSRHRRKTGHYVSPSAG